MISTKIYIDFDEFSEDWVGQSTTKTMVRLLTSKYTHAFKQLDIDAEVIITIDVDDITKTADKDVQFIVKAGNKADEDQIWNVIIKVATIYNEFSRKYICQYLL